MLNSKLYFHQHITYIYSRALKLLRPIYFATNNLSPLDSFNISCVALFVSKLEYAFVVWNSSTLPDSNKLKKYKINLLIIVKFIHSVSLFSRVWQNYHHWFRRLDSVSVFRWYIISWVQ
jgi:hypothetical protein